MAYPSYRSRRYGDNFGATDTTKLTISYPAGATTGDLVTLQVLDQQGNTPPLPSGFTQIYLTSGRMVAYRRVTEASPSSFALTFSGLANASYLIVAFSGADTILTSSQVVATDTSPNPPSLSSPWPAGQEIKWVATFMGVIPSGGSSVTAYPSGYSGTFSVGSTVLFGLYSMGFLDSTTSPQDPGAFTLSNPLTHISHTFALTSLAQYIEPGTIPSAESVPSPTVLPGSVGIEPAIIASAEMFFATCEVFFYPPAFAPEELCFPMISSSGLGIYPDIIPSAETFYSHSIEVGDGCVITKIGGVSYPMRNGTLRIEDNVSDRSTAEFVVIDRGGLWEFERGSVVRIWDRFSNLAFAGVVDSSQRYRIHEGTFEHYIVCADNHYFADKRIAAQTYSSMTAGDIVRDLILDYLAAEGITVGVIEDGPTVIETVFNYIPVSEALDQLATIAGFWWSIDVDKKLYFVNPNYHALSFSMTGSEMQRGTVQVTNKNPKYRNRQYVKGGKAITDLQTEMQFGDGSKQAFAVRYPIAQAPTVEVSYNGGAWIAQTRGIKGLDTGFDWYWSKGDLVLAQEIADAPLAAADRLRVKYFGQWPIVTISERTDEVTRMQTLQGGSGRVEDVVQDAQIDTREAAFQLANSNLQKYSQNSIRVQFDTLQYGLEVGRLVNIVLPDYGIDDNFLIERLEIWQDAHLVWYRAHCLEGPSEGTWQRFFAEIARRGRPQIDQENIGEDEVLITLVSFSEAIGWAESTTVTPIACPICGVATLAGAGTIVC